MICYGPVALNKNENSPWEDVWLEYEIRRKIIKEGPCFVCGVDGEIRHQKDMIEFVGRKKGDKKNINKEYYEEELERLNKIKERFDAGEKFICDNWESGLPNIYINCKEMRRKEIEEATDWYLREKEVLKSKPRFKWNKPKFIVVPT